MVLMLAVAHAALPTKGNCSLLTGIPNMPNGGRVGLSSASVGTLSYWIGGYLSSQTLTSLIEIFDASSLQWRVQPPPPSLSSPKAYTMTGVIGTKVYIAGGKTSAASSSSAIEILETATSPPSFLTAKTLSQARFGGAVVSFQNDLYIGGGATSDPYNPFSNTVDVIRGQSNTITSRLFTLGVKRMALAGAACGSKIVFAGGEQSHPTATLRYTDWVDIFDVSTGQFKNGSFLSMGRRFLSGVGYDNQCFFAGGQTWTSYSSNVDIYHAIHDSWRVLSLSLARTAMSTEVITNQIYFIGGNTGTSVSNQVDILDVETNVFSTQTIPFAQSDATSITGQYVSALKEWIVLAGGYSSSTTMSSTTQLYSCSLPLLYTWNATQLCSECSTGCGVGTKTCQVYCIDQFFRRADQDSFCNPATKPGITFACTSTRSCNIPPPPSSSPSSSPQINSSFSRFPPPSSFIFLSLFVFFIRNNF
jgi:hypothetical protein